MDMKALHGYVAEHGTVPLECMYHDPDAIGVIPLRVNALTDQGGSDYAALGVLKGSHDDVRCAVAIMSLEELDGLILRLQALRVELAE